MAQKKLSYDQFVEAVNPTNHPFVQALNSYLQDNGCKATYEAKKTGLLGSYKHTKTKKSIINLLQKDRGLLVRIYGENSGKYLDFLNTLPDAMVQEIDSAGDCGRLVSNTCSPKCSGYDVVIKDKRYQKCRYSGFEFLVTDETGPYIRSFVEHEVNGRFAV